MQLPTHIPYLIIGAGVHGLSTAWHLAKELKARGKGSGEDIIVVDKESIASGASGIACGVVRNFYYQPAMGEVMRVSVDVWESDPEAFHYYPVGYLAAVPEVQAADIETIHGRQAASGYRSSLVRGEQKVFDYMRQMFPDWKARGLTAVLHEHQGGFAFNSPSMHGLATKAQAEGVRILVSTEVKSFDIRGGSVHAVETNRGTVTADQVVVAVGPWIKSVWSMLGLANKIDVRTPSGDLHKDLEMWTYWRLLEGEIRVNPQEYVTADGKIPPVIHIDSTEPLISDKTGQLITDGHWGIYFKQDKHGIQGGAVPDNIGHEAQVDPYGVNSPYYVVKEDFVDYWTAGLAHSMERFEGCSVVYHYVPSGGIGAFTVDNFPIFDYMLPNAYVIADSNHGYKMIGVGKEVAKAMMGEHSSVLHPFRYGRYAEGDLHPTSSSPFPWS
ncbi:MAG: FAD-binding oxidoreductase [Chloroflexi bacterium]|nr:FAD-binding oxidoreductase [Chloroflexota bacterium]